MIRWPLLCAAVMSIAGSALSAGEADSPWLVRTWRSDDGLPNNYVTGIVQSPDGYLWVGTYSCLARFDGVRFANYLPKDLPGVDTSKTTTLHLARDGSLWIGSLHGAVIRLNPRGARVITTGLPEKQVQAIAEDGEGSIWVCYQHVGGSLYRIRDDRTTAFSKTEGVPTPAGPISSICVDTGGRLWVAKSGVLCVFDGSRFGEKASLPPGSVQLGKAASGGLWVCAADQLLRYTPDGRLQNVGRLESDRPDLLPTAVLEDSRGGVWVGTADSGLFHYSAGRFEGVSVSDAEISSIFEDRDHHLWVGTGSGGLDLVAPRVVSLETTEAGLPFNAARSLCEDAQGAIWAVTQNDQLVRRSAEGWDPVPLPTKNPREGAFCVASGPDGSVWVGTRDFHLIRFHGAKPSVYSKKEGILGQDVRGVLISRDTSLWVVESGPDTLQHLVGGRIETLPLPPDAHLIRAMAEDTSGTLWLGSTNGYLLSVLGGKVQDQSFRLGAANRSIRSLLADADGCLWIAFADDGLGRLRGGQFLRLGVAQGFPEANLSQIAADDRGWMWFGGDHGLFKVRKDILLARNAAETSPLPFVRYGRSEGLNSMEAGYGSSPGASRGSDGRLWFPMRTGVAVIDPSVRAEREAPPPALVERVSVDDHTVAAYGRIAPVFPAIDLNGPRLDLRLDPAHYRVAFEFTALGFAEPENLRFRYRLNGLEQRWTDAGTSRLATYSRLPAGNYSFQVEASDGEGTWSEPGAQVPLVVAPFFWQSWWFRVAAVLGFTAITAAAVRAFSLSRVRRQLQDLEQQAALGKERARIARDLHDEFGSRLTELGLIAELDLKQAGRGEPGRHGSELVEGLRSLERDLDMMIWAVNPRNDSLNHLVSFICRATDEFLRRSDISCRLEIPEELPSCPLNPELRQHLFLVVREAVSNVVKHSRATAAKISFRLVGDYVHFRLEDDGCGFSLEEAGSRGRNGLQNMRSRVEEIGGEFHVRSGAARGTVIEFRFPLQRALAPGLEEMPVSTHPHLDPKEPHDQNWHR